MASARPSGPERPNKMEYKETPAKIAIADAGASNSDPTRRSTAVLPSHSVARTNPGDAIFPPENPGIIRDRKSTRLNSSHQIISYAVFCLKKKKNVSNIL